MNKIWVTSCGMVHYRKPEQEAKEYVEVTDSFPQVSGMGVAVEADNEMPKEIWASKNRKWWESEPATICEKYIRADLAYEAAKTGKAVEDVDIATNEEWFIERVDHDGGAIDYEIKRLKSNGTEWDDNWIKVMGANAKSIANRIYRSLTTPTPPNAALDARNRVLAFIHNARQNPNCFNAGLDFLDDVEAALSNTETKG
ncbi:hypothetical protein [Caudoviricetes sp.]|nr:hypothetical protein [Caudoviricetes sp.]